MRKEVSGGKMRQGEDRVCGRAGRRRRWQEEDRRRCEVNRKGK